jgi:hypothetical protein
MEKVVVTVWVDSRVPLAFIGIFWEFFYVRKVVFYHSVYTARVALAVNCM